MHMMVVVCSNYYCYNGLYDFGRFSMLPDTIFISLHNLYYYSVQFLFMLTN